MVGATARLSFFSAFRGPNGFPRALGQGVLDNTIEMGARAIEFCGVFVLLRSAPKLTVRTPPSICRRRKVNGKKREKRPTACRFCFVLFVGTSRASQP